MRILRQRPALGHLSVVCAILILLSACGGQHRETDNQLQASASVAQNRPPERITSDFLGTVAVAKVEIEHPSAKLVYRQNGVSDTIVRQLQGIGNYRVIDWTNLQDVLFRRNLEWSDLQNNQDVGRQLQDVLFNDYFLMGTVTSYGERMDFSSSAFSKSKKQIVSASIELAVKNAFTNEIVASAQGTGEESRSITQTLGFGAAGGVDTVIATAVLDKAIQDGVYKLTARLAALPRPGTSSELGASSVVEKAPPSLPNNLKILCIFLEKEEEKKRVSAENALQLSIAEHAMAKEFLHAGAKVLTADDVVNHAYSMSGGENLLAGGWATEEDFFAVENLLQARSGLAGYAVTVGKTAGADIVVSGTVTFQTQPGTATPQGLRSEQSTAFLAVKAIDVRSGETLELVSTRQNFMALATPSALNARSNALELAAKKAALQILKRLQDLHK